MRLTAVSFGVLCFIAPVAPLALAGCGGAGSTEFGDGGDSESPDATAPADAVRDATSDGRAPADATVDGTSAMGQNEAGAGHGTIDATGDATGQNEGSPRDVTTADDVIATDDATSQDGGASDATETEAQCSGCGDGSPSSDAPSVAPPPDAEPIADAEADAHSTRASGPCETKTDCAGSQVCDVDAGSCVDCVSDGDCTDGGVSRCDTSVHACVTCLPVNDNCATGAYCAQTNGDYACVAGCKADIDCQRAGGTVTSACCDHACVDLTASNGNCGACGMACSGSSVCCSGCVDPRSDSNNCGACGHVCRLANASSLCAGSVCNVTTCNTGFDDCNHTASDGCEADKRTDPNNCGACGNVCSSGACSDGVCLYAPAGVQTNVPVATVTAGGWSQCYLDTYNVDIQAALGAIENTSCMKGKLMLACRTAGATTLLTAAWAARADVFFETGASATSTTLHVANGVGWYFDPAWSWGFAPATDTINRFTCDTITTDGASRLCWQTSGGVGGYRCGTNTKLNNSTAFERIIYQAD